jgi:hypothetical protein
MVSGDQIVRDLKQHSGTLSEVGRTRQRTIHYPNIQEISQIAASVKSARAQYVVLMPRLFLQTYSGNDRPYTQVSAGVKLENPQNCYGARQTFRNPP